MCVRECNQLSDDGIICLSKHCKLKYLDTSWVGISKQQKKIFNFTKNTWALGFNIILGEASLVSLASEVPGLSVFKLSWCNIVSDQHLASHIHKFKLLTELDIR